MKVLMTKDVKGVGQRGAIVEVSDGYALNSLIPGGKAVQATPEKIAQHNKQMEAASFEKAKHDAETATKLRTIDGKRIVIKAKANEKGHLFRKVKGEDVATEIGNYVGLAIDPEVIRGIGQTLNEIGDYVIHVVDAGVDVAVTIGIEAIN